MHSTIAIQLYSLFVFTISGVAIGIFFDIFRVLRRSFKTSDIITYLEDILFWILTGSFFLYILFKYNNGQIRSYVLIGTATGVIIYMLTISRYFIKINVFIVTTIKKIIIYPIKVIISFFKKVLKPITFMVINIKKGTKNVVKKCTNKIRIVNKNKKLHTEKRSMKKNVE